MHPVDAQILAEYMQSNGRLHLVLVVESLAMTAFRQFLATAHLDSSYLKSHAKCLNGGRLALAAKIEVPGMQIITAQVFTLQQN